MNIRNLLTVAVTGTALLLGGCATSDSANVYKRSQMRNAATVQSGVVEQVREVRMEDSTGIGAVAGGVIGGVAAGRNIGGGSGRVVSGVIGTIVGGLIGNRLEEQLTSKDALEVTVLLDNGQRLVVVQEADQPLAPEQRVNVLSDGQNTRVVPSNDPPPGSRPSRGASPAALTL
ncbi:hypothetical protein N8I74_02500 [Chitiniphilus purpureus]|uniref:Glycine zipper 2TM domain-containing protein n=1 Tax=Chitiniphilus purpureus TaxID=2981137 RepID=A0ABY6DNJ2_9NEIS|nr:hypothetical protein [Chitiniphilus sp. CD1]UXY15907.1 hypothetical protein N8I74_02500 [Chitiniphilus sp. CD1]